MGVIQKKRGIALATLHYASGNNINSQGNFAPAKAGFNLADVSSVDELNALPPGVKGLVWLDQGDGVTQSFIDAVTPYIGNPNVYGFFLKDEPDPTGQWGDYVTAANLKAESDWIHSHVTGAKTFITMMNMGSSDNPSFANTYTPENTHIDLFGIDPYPVRSGSGPVDYNMIDKAVAAAEASGIPTANIVPGVSDIRRRRLGRRPGRPLRDAECRARAANARSLAGRGSKSGLRLCICLGFAERRCGARKFARASECLPATQYERKRDGGCSPGHTACYRPERNHAASGRYKRRLRRPIPARAGATTLAARRAIRRHLRPPTPVVGGTITTMGSISRKW